MEWGTVAVVGQKQLKAEGAPGSRSLPALVEQPRLSAGWQGEGWHWVSGEVP